MLALRAFEPQSGGHLSKHFCGDFWLCQMPKSFYRTGRAQSLGGHTLR